MTTEIAPGQEQSADPALQADRRGAERYSCDLRPFWRIAGEAHADAPPAIVQDISATGIGLHVRQALKPGTVLVLTLQTRDHRLSRPLPVRVMHSTALADGEWLAGCRFIRPLSGQDFRALVGDE